MHKESNVWEVSPRDLAMLNQKLSLCQISVVPETANNTVEELDLAKNIGSRL